MTVHVACLCAAWCRTCESYQQVFEAACAELPQQGLRVRWIDIEDEAELIGDLDIETFPTLLIADDEHVRFAGPLTPQPETLRRRPRWRPDTRNWRAASGLSAEAAADDGSAVHPAS
jgi:thiol-disulfide isomerase/thioredoxin